LQGKEIVTESLESIRNIDATHVQKVSVMFENSKVCVRVFVLKCDSNSMQIKVFDLSNQLT
jgi:hypothetical protein